MRILYISQYFPPEAGASQARAHELARNLVGLGHQVTMLAEIPNHPAGIIPPEYRGKLYQRAALDGIDVIHVWVKTSPHKTYRTRLLFYLSFMFTSALAGLFLARGKFDVLYVDSPPLLSGAAGLAISFLRRIPFVFEVCDLWPESAVALGELTNPRAIALATRLEEACYRRARRIVVVTHAMIESLVGRAVPAEKLVLIPNGANTELFHFDVQQRLAVRASLGLQNHFVAIYAGLHGIAQGLETVLQAADLLRQDPHIQFILLGEGPCKPELIALAERLGLTNVRFIPEQPREYVPHYLSAADVALVPLKDIPLFQGALPSKLFDAWACSRPAILSVAGEARQLVEAVQAGLLAPPEDAAALAENIRWLKEHPAQGNQMGANGRTFTVAHHSHPALAKKLEQVLRSAINSG